MTILNPPAHKYMTRTTRLHIRSNVWLLLIAALSSILSAVAGELTPSFPNHAIVALPTEQSRAALPQADDTTTVFTWDQSAVVLEGTGSTRIYRAYDPMFQAININILPATPTHLRVNSFDGNFNVQAVTIFAKQGGTSEVFQFQAIAGGVTSATANFTYDIRATGTKLRGSPSVSRTEGDYIKPGQIVKYSWTPTTANKFANCEAALTGRTGPAKGYASSVITRVLATKVQPMILGHYLMIVTPREVRGQPALGSPGNGVVFRCVFGTDNLPPVTDGFSADTFTPDAGRTITLNPNVTDPETGQTTFSNELFDFGDGTTAAGLTGSTTHAFTNPGVYRVRCTVADNLGAKATAADTVIVGATNVPTIALTYVKQIPPEEAGDGLNNADTLNVTFKDPSGAAAGAGDRIVFAFNRNHYEYVAASSSDTVDTVPIVLGKGKTFTGTTAAGAVLTVAAAGPTISIAVTKAQLDRTGDPRFGRCDLLGIFKNQRIAVSVIPANGSTPRALVYTGNVTGKVKNGTIAAVPETQIAGTATTKEPNPRLQEP